MTFVQKYAARIRKEPGRNGCWVWTGGRYKTGYGGLNFKMPSGKWNTARVHRLSWQSVHGPIPRGLWVLHRCDNRPCVRPSHLYLGDIKQNTRDAVERARLKHGEEHHATKLNEVAVRVIRYFLAKGVKQRRLAEAYGVPVRTISGIKIRRTWRRVA